MSRRMSPDEIASFLRHGTRTAKVATTMGDGQPHVMPVWFGSGPTGSSPRPTLRASEPRRFRRVGRRHEAVELMAQE
jgi:nitroimidazol reductase NimA-like FMN-containing flavoprotein (pyridoxamine 5'-phosphate oxidase superfamily)